MDNLTQDTLPMHIDNYSEPVLPDHPIRYVEKHNVRIATLMLMMAPLWVLSGWLTIYGLIIFFCKLSNIVYKTCVEKKQKTVCEGEFECKKGCENCNGRIFLKHKNSKV